MKEKETLPEAAKKVNLKQDPATKSKKVHSKGEKEKEINETKIKGRETEEKETNEEE